MKIHPVAAELFRVAGQTDTMMPTVDIRNFVTTPKN
jgi:hypothetical protein